MIQGRGTTDAPISGVRNMFERVWYIKAPAVAFGVAGIVLGALAACAFLVLLEVLTA